MYASQRPNRPLRMLLALIAGLLTVGILAGCGGKTEKPKDANYYDGPQKKLGDSQKAKGGSNDVQ